ncbi:MAG: ABC transporter ATP-binding protein [Nitrososphaerota archaeon]|nr:ABC transporter ATP-binding protein [Nitrososphaerota archaeon]
MTLVELIDVSKRYAQSEYVLKNIDLKILESDFLVIRGRSGIGKSTLLRIAGLLDTPSSGTVLVNGVDSSKMKDAELSRLRLRNFGFVFQRFNLIPALTTLENVELPMELAGSGTEERRKRAEELLSYFGISEHAKKYPGELSVGQQQRVAIARALANNPRILLADEPISSVDEETAGTILGLFERLNRERHVSVVITTTSFSEEYNSTQDFRVSSGTLTRLTKPE